MQIKEIIVAFFQDILRITFKISASTRNTTNSPIIMYVILSLISIGKINHKYGRVVNEQNIPVKIRREIFVLSLNHSFVIKIRAIVSIRIVINKEIKKRIS